MSEYRERLVRAITALTDLEGEERSVIGDTNEAARLKAKKEGVQLALSYYDEMRSE